MNRHPELANVSRAVFYELRAMGCRGTRGYQPRRIIAGYDESAWSKPTVEIHGIPKDQRSAALACLEGLKRDGIELVFVGE